MTTKEDLDLLLHVARSFGVMRPAVQSGEAVVRYDDVYEFALTDRGRVCVTRHFAKKDRVIVVEAMVWRNASGHLSCAWSRSASVASLPASELVTWVQSIVDACPDVGISECRDVLTGRADTLTEPQLDALTTSRTNDQIRAIAIEENRRRGRPTLW